jgi:hypothetical protein
MLIRDKHAFCSWRNIKERVGEVEGLSFETVTHWIILDQQNENAELNSATLNSRFL